MDQAQTRALTALQPFVHLSLTSKAPSPRIVTDLINRAISAPGTYVFTELLQTPAVQSLRGDDVPAEQKAWLTLLEIFSWGTYEEYQATPGLPTLTEAQALKLRHLSLLSLASPFAPQSSPTTQTTSLTYDSLLQSLDLADPAALETLVTSAIYTGLLTARLSPTSTPPAVDITAVAPLRDLRPLSLPSLLAILNTWSSRCDSVIADLENSVANIQATAAARQTIQTTRQAAVDNAVLNIQPLQPPSATGERGRGSGGQKRDFGEQADEEGSDGEMDVDEGVEFNSGNRGGGNVGGSGRGAKRNRGRGSSK